MVEFSFGCTALEPKTIESWVEQRKGAEEESEREK